MAKKRAVALETLDLINDCTSAARQCEPGSQIRTTLERAALRLQTFHDLGPALGAKREAVAAATLVQLDERSAIRAALVMLRGACDQDSFSPEEADEVLPVVDFIIEHTEA